MAISSLPGAPSIGAAASPSAKGTGILSTLPGAPKIAPVSAPTTENATPTSPASGGIVGQVKTALGIGPAETTTPAAPTPATSSGVLSTLPGAPTLPQTTQPAVPAPTGPTGPNYTPLGPPPPTTAGPPKPTLNPFSSSSFGPAEFYSGPGVAARNDLKTQIGPSYSDNLDHSIATNLAGGAPANPAPGSTDHLASQAISGQIPLVEAHQQASGVPASSTTPALLRAPTSQQGVDLNNIQLYNPQGNPIKTVGQYAEEAQQAKAVSDEMNAPGAAYKRVVTQALNWSYTLGSTLLQEFRAAVSSPKGALAASQGVVQIAALKPLAFIGGISSGILNAEDTGLDKVFGTDIAANNHPVNSFAGIASINDNLERTPDEQKAYDAGNFIGFAIPFSRISQGVEAAADTALLATTANAAGGYTIGNGVRTLSSLLPYIADAAGFLGTGQILHSPDEGSRVQQLKNDAIALALFDVGGFALKGGATMLAKGLANVLPAAVKETATAALQPVVDKLRAGENVPADMLDNAVTRANGAIQDATGKTPQELLQDHLGLSGEQPKIPISPETVPAHNPVEKAIPMYHEQNMGRYQTGLVAIGQAKGQLATLQKQIKSFPEDPALQTDLQKATIQKAASLDEYVNKNKTFEQYWSGTKPGETESRAQSALHSMTDNQAAQYHQQYKADIARHVALGYDMPKEITDQFPETKSTENPGKSVDEIAQELKTSGHDYDAMIKSGDLPKSAVYNEDGTLVPERAQHVVDDLAEKLNEHEAGLGDKFKASVDMSKATPEDLQDQATKILTDDRPKSAAETAQRYWNDVIAPGLKGGKTVEVSGDSMKQHFGNDYDTAKSDRYAQASYQTMQKLIEEPSVHDITILGGGPGAGKSELLGNAIKADNTTDVLYDTTLSSVKGSGDIIRRAESAGKEVHIAAILPDLDRALQFTVDRAEATGRHVTPEAFARGHAGFVETLRTLLSDGTLKPSQVELYDLRGKSLEESKSMVANHEFSKDPLATLKEIGYTKENLESRYGSKERQNQDASTETPPGSEVARSGEGDRGLLSPFGTEEEGGKKEIALPAFPRQGQLVMGVAFPGADIVAKFIQKDVIERFGGLKDAVKGIYNATKDLFTTNVEHEKAAAIVGSRLMETEKYASSAWKVAEARRDWWAKVPEDQQYEFLDKMETGGVVPEDFESRVGPKAADTMADLSNEYRARLNKAFEFEGSKGVEENYIQNYFPHMWEDPEEAARALTKFSENMPQGYSQAFGSFKSPRIVDLIKTGRSLGLKLITSNPEELVIIREIDGQRIAARMSIMQELEGEGLAHPTDTFLEYGKPSNWSLVKGSDGTMYAVAPDAAKILNNAFFAPSFWTMSDGLGQKTMSAMFKAMMAIKGTVVPFQLSLSGFHPIHIATIASADAITDSFMKVVNGDMGAADGFTEMAKGFSMVPQAFSIRDYWNIGKAWDTPMEKLQPRMRAAVQAIIDGGGTPKISEEFSIRASDGFKKAVSDGNYIGAAIRGVPKVVEALQEPILGHYVPSLKIGAYLSKVEDLLHKDPTLATNDIARKVAYRAAWNEVDSRFGEMVYKTKFWNPLLTQIGEASFLSLGWQLGFVDQFVGGALDLAKLAVKSAGGPLGLTEKATRADLTSRSVFSVVYTLQAAMWGGLMTYAMTGKMPQTVQDLFYPNTGKTNSDGSQARLNTPFYTREFFTLVNHIEKQGIVGGPISMIQNKANPILNSLAEIWNNKDFYGYEIHDPNSNIAQQAEQVMSYLVKNNFTPISIQGAIQANNITGRLGVAASIAGFNPAPKYIAENAIQTKIFATLDERTGGSKPLDSQAAANAKSNIKKLYQSGDSAGANTALKAAIAAGYIKSTGLTTFMKDADLPGDVLAFKDLDQFPSDQESLLASMNESDLQRYAQYAASSVRDHLSSLSSTAAQFVKDIQSGKIKVDTFKAGKITTQ